MEIVGLIPAAGKAKRILPIPCSKELFPVGLAAKEQADIRIKVASHCLLEKMKQAGAAKGYIILRKGKWDIPAYWGDGAMIEMPLAYLMMGLPYGVPYTLDQAYPFVKDSLILFGFPDILFEPQDAFVQLIHRQHSSGVDIVLGLFTADQPSLLDMVDIDEQGSVRGIEVKPADSKLHYAWIIAVWTPAFTLYLHDFVARNTARNIGKNTLKSDLIFQELHIGSIIDSAVQDGLRVNSVIFPENRFLDIGIPENLYKAHKF